MLYEVITVGGRLVEQQHPRCVCQQTQQRKTLPLPARKPRHGDTVEELLRYVEFDPAQLLARYRAKIAAAGLDAAEQSAYQQFLASGLEGYTYLEEP